LVGYFEHIDIKTLYDQLIAVGVREVTARIVRDLLESWSTPSGHGIPQGLDSSSLLGNFYLNPIDKAMVRAGVKYLRFVDDICILLRLNQS
jgi:hypothetical protein